MAFADTAVRNVVQGSPPIKATLEAACEVGDLLAYGTTGWVLADASDGSLPATLIAGEKGAAGQTITAFQSAVVDGPTGMTPGASLYLSDTAGKYSASSGTVEQVVGKANSATRLFVNLAAMHTVTAKLRTAKTSVQDIDTIGAANYDEVILVPSTGIKITEVRIVYDKEQSGTVAGGSVKVGTTAGGEQIVAATALENAKAVGYCKVCTLVAGTVAADTPIFVRITGVAATQAGAVHVEMDYYTTDPA